MLLTIAAALKGLIMEISKPKQERFDEISKLISDFCKEKLNDEYKDMCMQLCASLFRKRPSPIAAGDANTWACGIVNTVGRANFLYDIYSNPHIKVKALYEWFGIPESTGSEILNQISETMKIYGYEQKWILPSKRKEFNKSFLKEY